MEIFYAVITFILGALLTSFYQLIAERIPKKESLMGRSHCDQCRETLKFIDVLPIIGYLINKGKCRSCRKKISPCYPMYELIGGLIFLLTYLYVGFSYEMLIIITMYSVFFIEAISDLKHTIVIDRIWMIGVIPLIIIRILENTWKTYLLSSLVLFASLFIIAYLSSMFYKKEALGGGDVKLYFFIGWLLTLTQGFLSLFLASILGLIYGMIKLKKKSQAFPLVPFIAYGVVISYFYGDALIQAYLNLFGM
ncbi:MAG: prepilin peptidase [Acholeplasmataceae bacterium]|jgi:prepilin signal peptidase PulO-like enzyme (type II secretory pathway)|nr:prepilin peptidase [Acholeplasmataceae bacterium]